MNVEEFKQILKDLGLWRGIVALGALLGINIAPELQKHILELALGLYTAFHLISSWRKNRNG